MKMNNVIDLVPEFPVAQGKCSFNTDGSIVDNYDFFAEPNVFGNYIYLSTKYGSDKNDDRANNYVITPDNLIEVADMLHDVGVYVKTAIERINSSGSVLTNFYNIYKDNNIKRIEVKVDEKYIDNFENTIITNKADPMYGRLVVFFEYEKINGEISTYKLITDSYINERTILPTIDIERKLKQNGIECDLDIENFEYAYKIIQEKLVAPVNEEATSKIISMMDEMIKRKNK